MIQTENMYFAAFLMNEGLAIESVKQVGRKVVFGFTAHDGEIENNLSRHYNEETAVTNVRKYLNALITVRDIIYRVSQNSRWDARKMKFKVASVGMGGVRS